MSKTNEESPKPYLPPPAVPVAPRNPAEESYANLFSERGMLLRENEELKKQLEAAKQEISRLSLDVKNVSEGAEHEQADERAKKDALYDTALKVSARRPI